MKYLISLVGTVVLLNLYSCKKDDIDSNAPAVQSFIPLNIGNFWVYENVILDQYGNDSLIQSRDSIYINRDTVISGQTYSVLEGRYPVGGTVAPNVISIQRDSAGYLINHLGEVLFSNVNFTDTLNTNWGINNNDTIFVAYSKTLSGNQLITTPAGEFDALAFETTFISFLGSQNHTEISNTYYSNGVGKILQPWKFYGPNFQNATQYQIRLVKFHIES